MSASEKTRAELVARALQRRAFLAEALPEERDTLVDFRRLLQLAAERGKEYRTASPFPHIVIDDFLPPDGLRAVLDAMPPTEAADGTWGNLDANLADGRPAQAKKLHLFNVLRMKPALRQLIAELNSGPFTFILRELTGIDNLVVDAQLLGGGVHVVKPGGLLRVHADFRRHLSYNLERRLNLLIYMNEGWQEAYGGHLELWDRQMSRCERRVLPVANRCVIFNTTDDSFHGHPHPLTCPEGTFRRSIALYYYTVDSATVGNARDHSTAWQDLPEERDEKPGS